MKIAVLATAIIAAAMAFALRDPLAGSRAMWLGLVLPYVALSLYAIYRMYEDGTLLDVMSVRAGDVTIGAVAAAALFGGAYAIRKLLLAGMTPQSAWLLHIALELGSMRPSPAMFGIVTLLAICEELTWRGLVLSALTADLGNRRAWPIAAVAYGAAHLPTLFTLADPTVGPNPLLVFAALGCGLVWSFVASVLGRLPPVIVSHAVFSYFALAVLLPRFL